MHDRAIWKTAPPLWRDGLTGTVEINRPAILRFDTDDFMTRLQANLDDAEHRNVGAFVLRPETWRQPAAGLQVPATSQVPRLYQPMHGRFYLVTGGLVCERYGLPDKAVHPNRGESFFYVLRRFEPAGALPIDPSNRSTFREFGWVPSGPAGRWVAAPVGLVAGEERLPLFPMTYVDDRRRRMLAGTMPVAARERYEGALPPKPIGPHEDDPAAVLALPGRARLVNIVYGLKALRQLAQTPAITGASAIELFREATFFTLVDLAAFLAEEMPAVWDGTPNAGFPGLLTNRLTQTQFRADAGAPNWLSALHKAHANRNAVLAELAAAPAPVTGASVADIVNGIKNLGVTLAIDPLSDPLYRLVNKALGAAEATTSPHAEPSDSGTAAPNRVDRAVYAARLVYERPLCRPPHRLTISEPSEAFQLAHFYDPDAPFRENRIVLPVDTSLEGLRKFPQAVKIELSAQLRKQMERIQAIKLKDLDEGNIPGERPLDLGLVCSLSIPIITICALVLLIIIVSLLNIVFFWLPLFRICLPKAP